MQFRSALAFIALLVSLPLTLDAQNLPNDYIVIENVNLAKGGLMRIMSANGMTAFRLIKDLNTPSNGKTTTTLTDGFQKKLFALVSSNDDCKSKTTFTQLEGPVSKDGLPKRAYSYDPRGFRSNVWRFNVYNDAAGARQYYKFIKNRTNKGGIIYRVARGQGDVMVGRLRGQSRQDSWLNVPGGISTFTLSCTEGAPLPELVTMLAYAHIRHDQC
ncbi:uncharacterized protein PGTG_19497 [Puccinia graminis f. sp. tritici CRL 75-36-700-3]|uniref:Uncharacterized protein n=1 Tax=Puccinia graminis f. sp. tritici (strain CRL 75-36-700-3 / race SCCL) TaxID=418459 RepID=E3LA45_PUCGT|nr:uncharacterized protein PGTG_19497 [Puccinia graminis f. sp. tritici CRL 75-36-700-3]EFP93420.1 hypothetical protein PGTG_19497 [Puccinia graminis f. sp. tritici CRL 75-36-700-3]